MNLFLSSVPGYVYAQSNNDLYVNLFISNSSSIKLTSGKVNIAQTTNYPWNGKIELPINPEKTGSFTLHVRIPGWAQQQPVPGDLYNTSNGQTLVSILINGKPFTYKIEKGLCSHQSCLEKGRSGVTGFTNAAAENICQ